MIGFNVSGRSTDQDRREGKTAGIVERYDQRRTLSGVAGHGGQITGVSPGAIEFQRVYLTGAGGRHMADCSLIGLAGTYLMVAFVLHIGSWMFFAFFAYLELFSPADSPIYFDRKQRKVYKVTSVGPRRWRCVGPRKAILTAYDWSLVDAEHHVSVQAIDRDGTAQPSPDIPRAQEQWRPHHHRPVRVHECRDRLGTVGVHPSLHGRSCATSDARRVPSAVHDGCVQAVERLRRVVPFLDQPARRWRERPWKTFLPVPCHSSCGAVVCAVAVLQPFDGLDRAKGGVARADRRDIGPLITSRTCAPMHIASCALVRLR
jgi:hypothetical protein